MNQALMVFYGIRYCMRYLLPDFNNYDWTAN